MTCDITNPAFTNEDEARKLLEASRWPDGPFCPFCGQIETVKPLGGNSMGPGWYYCSDCQSKFTVRVGTLYERSHIPLHKWLLATHLVVASKKGMSALQLSRMLGITYKSAWFMCHRIREGMAPKKPGPIGGENKVVEADETFVGGKKKNRAFAKKEPKKQVVMTLVDRDGESRSFHVADVSAKTLREKIVTTVSRKSYLATDELASYEPIGREFAGHGTVNHSADEYRGQAAHVPQPSQSLLQLSRRLAASSLGGGALLPTLLSALADLILLMRMGRCTQKMLNHTLKLGVFGRISLLVGHHVHR